MLLFAFVLMKLIVFVVIFMGFEQLLWYSLLFANAAPNTQCHGNESAQRTNTENEYRVDTYMRRLGTENIARHQYSEAMQRVSESGQRSDTENQH